MNEVEIGILGVATPEDEAPEFVINEDGSATIDVVAAIVADHSSNLAEFIDDEDLTGLSNELMDAFEADLKSRSDWEDTYREGLEILGLKLEDVDHPFRGACGAHHPLMLEAALQFQARAIGELFPAGGPVKTVVLGDRDAASISQAQRVKEFMNYQVTEQMEEFFDELDTLLFHLPLAGSAFKKTYYDEGLGRPVSVFVPAEKIVVPYGTSNLQTTPRLTQVIEMDENEIRKLQVRGFYLDVDLEEADAQSTIAPDVQKQKDDIAGLAALDVKGLRRLLEFHVDLDIEDFPDVDEAGEPTGIKIPYVVTLDHTSGKVLAIRRNFEEQDTLKQKQSWFTHYKFLPGMGFYGLGLPHILGNLQKTATATLRSLVDAGQFANLPAGFKARGMRIEGGEVPLAFGEFRDVEGYGDDIRKSIIPIPVKEPSQTLFLLLGKIIDDARRLAAIADVNATDMNKEAPVGTTMALMEQGVKLMSAIHKRLHRAQRGEFKILARINRDFLPSQYPYQVEGGDRTVFATDFDSRVDVLPVSDPNIFSETQRILRAQTQLQLAQQFPQQHNLSEALRRMHEVIGTHHIDQVLNPDRGPKPMDPATENFALMQGKPVKAYAYQDHNAHLMAHQSQLMMLQSLVQQNPLYQQMMPMVLAHMAEHQAFMVLQQVQAMSGMQLPPPPDYDPTNPNRDDGYVSMDPQTENMVAQGLGMAAQQLAQQAQMMAQAQQAQQQAQDPQMMLLKAKVEADMSKAQAAQINAATARDSAQAELVMKDQQHRDKMALEVAKMQEQGQLDREQMAADMRTVLLNRAKPNDFNAQ